MEVYDSTWSDSLWEGLIENLEYWKSADNCLSDGIEEQDIPECKNLDDAIEFAKCLQCIGGALPNCVVPKDRLLYFEWHKQGCIIEFHPDRSMKFTQVGIFMSKILEDRRNTDGQ